MKRESRTVDRSHQVDSPLQRHLPLVDLLVDVRADLMELAGRVRSESPHDDARSGSDGDLRATVRARARARGVPRRDSPQRGRPRRTQSADSPAAGACAERACGVGGSLQSGTAARQSGARYPRSARRLPRAIFKRPSDPGRPPCRLQTGARRRAPRVSSRADGRMSRFRNTSIVFCGAQACRFRSVPPTAG